MALAVKSIRRIVPVDSDSLIPVDAERQERHFIRAVCNYDGDIINILDLPRLLAAMQKNISN